MDLEKLREMYRELENIGTSPQIRWLRGRLTVDQIDEYRNSLPQDNQLPELTNHKIDTAKELFAKEWDEKIFEGENAKDSIEDLKKVLRIIYSRIDRGTTGNHMISVATIRQSGGMRRKSQTARFCSCIKSVRKTLKARKGSTKEQGAIAVCVKSVLHTKGKTIKKFKCGKKMRVLTQKRK
jgi:hypothetical protein